MINARSNTDDRIRRRREAEKKNKNVEVWAERKPRGNGYIIYAGIPGTAAKTVAGASSSKDSLDYNLRKAQMKFLGIRN